MKKVLIILFLCILFSGCATFTKQGLYKHEQSIYREGIRTGYIMCLYNQLNKILEEDND